MHGVRGFLKTQQPDGGTAESSWRRRARHLSLGETELTVLPRDMFTDLYAATATLWKVEVTASNV